MATVGKVLLIEDNQQDSSFVTDALKEKGYSVVCAPTAQEGFRKIREERFGLIILDLILPDAGGEQVCLRLKKSVYYRKTPIIVFSVKDGIDDIEELFRRGADDYIIKPATADHLLSKVEKYIHP
jgi:two-component system phosphate regulon response regulator PhoB